MVGREVELIPGYDILYTWKGKRKLFDLLGVRTERQFALKMAELGKEDQLDDEMISKIFCIGLNWKKSGPIISQEDIGDLLEEFCQINGFGSEEINNKLLDAFCESGIYNKALIQVGRKISENKLKELERGTDTGEAGQISTLTM